MRRAQLPLSDNALDVLDLIPDNFVDDGCSNAPDSIFGFEFGWACRIHDWRYCTRAHPAGAMTSYARELADGELAVNIRQTLPWRWRWVRFVYRFFVHRYGGIDAYDSCGPHVERRCRHRLQRPAWFAELEI